MKSTVDNFSDLLEKMMRETIGEELTVDGRPRDLGGVYVYAAPVPDIDYHPPTIVTDRITYESMDYSGLFSRVTELEARLAKAEARITELEGGKNKPVGTTSRKRAKAK